MQEKAIPINITLQSTVEMAVFTTTPLAEQGLIVRKAGVLPEAVVLMEQEVLPVDHRIIKVVQLVQVGIHKELQVLMEEQ